jgi:uncharacterized membrane protein YqiK
MSVLLAIVAIAVIVAVIVAIVSLSVTRMYRKVAQGQALVINRVRDVDVTFSGGIVLPVLHKAEYMDISVKRLDVDRRGHDGLICKDHIRADVAVSFYIRVNPTRESVLDVAKLIGCDDASNPETLAGLFTAKFSEALKTVGKQMDFVDLYDQRVAFRDRVIETIGRDLNGYLLDDVAIEHLEQTPLESLDPDNILDAEGIRKITEITAEEAVITNDRRRDAEKRTKNKDVETAQAIFELDRTEQEARFRADRQIATTRATEEAAARVVEAEQRLAAEQAAIAADEQIGVRAENRDREIEVANRSRQRTVAVEDERVIQAAAIAEADRKTAAARSELDVEAARTDLAHRAAERTAAELEVAQREEDIARVRVVEAAQRDKEATVLTAEGLADARMREAEAEAGAIRTLGHGEGDAQKARLVGEAEGLDRKADAMVKLEGVGQEFEQFVRRLEADLQLGLARIGASKEIAAVQAAAIGDALREADISVVGGPDMFVDRVLGAANTGRVVDSFVSNSETVSAVAEPYVSGERDLLTVAAGAVGGLGADGIRDLTLASFLTNLDGPKAAAAKEALENAGLGDVALGELIGPKGI